MAAAAHGGLSPAPRLLPLGDAAWTVEFGAAIDPALHARVLALEAAVRAAQASGAPPWDAVQDVVPTFR
ncbi:MAG: carboxyltransferase domain-containing protein, partial [Tepidimonas sp.]